MRYELIWDYTADFLLLMIELIMSFIHNDVLVSHLDSPKTMVAFAHRKIFFLANAPMLYFASL